MIRMTTFVFRAPLRLIQELRKMAATERRTLSNLLRKILEDWLKR